MSIELSLGLADYIETDNGHFGRITSITKHFSRETEIEFERLLESGSVQFHKVPMTTCKLVKRSDSAIHHAHESEEIELGSTAIDSFFSVEGTVISLTSNLGGPTFATIECSETSIPHTAVTSSLTDTSHSDPLELGLQIGFITSSESHENRAVF
ncbi:hypothetical protein [Vibrio mediterranei]|uniref:hypothetical protein n=1 Tax=Vibrio mediterranei TaxID=689 RepID=UPI0040682990